VNGKQGFHYVYARVQAKAPFAFVLFFLVFLFYRFHSFLTRARQNEIRLVAG
jgi:hypothetical protein